MAVNILVVDDSLPMRSVIIKNIKASGYGSANFFQAENGKVALSLLENEWIDIVLTDYNMPDMNGLELICRIKSDEELSRLPVIVITTEGSQEKIEEFLNKGAADYIKKPFSPEDIREKLIKILGESYGEESNDEQSDDDLDF